MKTVIPILVALMTITTGCALQRPPLEQQLAAIPVVRFGDPIPQQGEYILYFPAGEPITTEVGILGDLFEADSRTQLTVRLKEDLYSYKKWISRDRQHWVGNSQIESRLDIKIPGHDHPQPGWIHLYMNEKP